VDRNSKGKKKTGGSLKSERLSSWVIKKKDRNGALNERISHPRPKAGILREVREHPKEVEVVGRAGFSSKWKKRNWEERGETLGLNKDRETSRRQQRNPEEGTQRRGRTGHAQRGERHLLQERGAGASKGKSCRKKHPLDLEAVSAVHAREESQLRMRQGDRK